MIRYTAHQYGAIERHESFLSTVATVARITPPRFLDIFYYITLSQLTCQLPSWLAPPPNVYYSLAHPTCR